MWSKYDEIRARRARGEQGFTLIELLVVVVILGVLVAIAIPVYLNYQKNSNDKAAGADVRNAIAVIENCYATSGSYPVANAGAPVDCALVTSPGTVLTYSITGTVYTLCAYNSNGSGDGNANFHYVSDTGGAVVQDTTAC